MDDAGFRHLKKGPKQQASVSAFVQERKLAGKRKAG